NWVEGLTPGLLTSVCMLLSFHDSVMSTPACSCSVRIGFVPPSREGSNLLGAAGVGCGTVVETCDHAPAAEKARKRKKSAFIYSSCQLKSLTKIPNGLRSMSASRAYVLGGKM